MRPAFFRARRRRPWRDRLADHGNDARDGENDGADGGFVLLESIMAIALITVLMVALTALFISAMQTTVHQRASQGAIRIATDQIDQARGLGYSNALGGRDRASVLAQFDAAPEAVRARLSGRDDQAYDVRAPDGTGRISCGESGTGTCALLPTIAVERSLSSTTFTVTHYEEWCYRNAADTTTADCVPRSEQRSGITYNQYLRVVIAIEWSDTTCEANGCVYVSALLLNGTAEPMFYFNDQPPPKPDLSSCSPRAVAVGDVYSTEGAAHPALNIVGTGGICTLEGGVPPVTWIGANLPSGLAVTAEGTVTGTVADDAVTTTASTITATDAFLIQGTSPRFTWKVLPRLVLHPPDDRVDVRGEVIAAFTVQASGGDADAYTFQAQHLPPGVSLSSSGTFSGTPTTVGDYAVEVTVTDATGWRTATGGFTWTVRYPPLDPVVPHDRISTVGAAIDPLTLTASGGSGSYTFRDPDVTVPPGLTLTDNTISGIPTAAGTFSVVLAAVDAAAEEPVQVPFTWTVNAAPAVSPPANTTTAPGGEVSGHAVGTAGTTPYTFSLDHAPSWMRINASTGELEGAASTDIADYPGIVVVLTDDRGAVARSAPFTWSVYEVPTLTPPGDQSSDFGESVSVQLNATCSTAPCTYQMTGNPDWLTLDATTGLMTGTAPETEGLFSGITVSVRDGRGTVASSQFTWVVGPEQTITSPGDQVWTVDTRLQNQASDGLQITADCGANGPCTFSLAPGSEPLPPGLAMDSSGLITGTPTTEGTTSGIIITATGTHGARSVEAGPFSWTINPKPTLQDPGNQRTVMHAGTTIQLESQCWSGPCAFAPVSLPDGLHLEPDGTFSGTAERPGTYAVQITVTDKTGASATVSFTWYVLGVEIDDLTMPRSSEHHHDCRSNSRLTLTVADFVSGYSDADNLTVDLSGDDDWVRWRDGRGELTITAPCSSWPSSQTVTVSVTDDGGNAASATASTTFTIRIEP